MQVSISLAYSHNTTPMKYFTCVVDSIHRMEVYTWLPLTTAMNTQYRCGNGRKAREVTRSLRQKCVCVAVCSWIALHCCNYMQANCISSIYIHVFVSFCYKLNFNSNKKESYCLRDVSAVTGVEWEVDGRGIEGNIYCYSGTNKICT